MQGTLPISTGGECKAKGSSCCLQSSWLTVSLHLRSHSELVLRLARTHSLLVRKAAAAAAVSSQTAAKLSLCL